MTMCLLLSALLALGGAAPAAAQFRAGPLTGALGAPAGMALPAPGLSAPISPSLPATAAFAPIPLLPASAITPSLSRRPSQAPIPRPSAVPAALAAVGPPQDAGSSAEGARDAAGAKLFDGAGEAKALADPALVPAALPFGAFSVTRVRVNSASEAAAFIPHEGNTQYFLSELPFRWDRIGWLDMRLYRDAFGHYFRAIDLSGRPGLIDVLPEVRADEASLIKKIQLHASDLQLVIREEGKTPDLIVSGVVTEMKSRHPNGSLGVDLAKANVQLLSHARRHGLAAGTGAVAVDLLRRSKVPVAEVLSTINNFAAANALGFSRVEVYAGAQRRVFIRGKNGLFYLTRG